MQATWLLGIALGVFSVRVWLHNRRDWLNPHFVISVDLAIKVVGAPLALTWLGLQDYPPEVLLYTNIVLLVSYVSFSVGFLVPIGPFVRRGLERILTPFDLPALPGVSLLVHLAVLLLGAFAAFLVMAQASGAGLLWITSSREAYQFYRTGVGPLYTASASLLFTAFILWVVFRLATAPFLWLALATGGFLMPAYFWGSKGFLLSFLVVAVTAYHYFRRPLGIPQLALTMAVLVLLFSAVKLLQEGTLLDAAALVGLLQYMDYYSNTCQFFQAFLNGQFPHTYGYTYLTGLWHYVPRVLIPAKPYDYGILYVNEVLWPGLAERSHTPAFLGPVAPFLNFGIPGVLLEGFLSGYIAHLFYRFFYEQKRPIGFVLYLSQIGVSIYLLGGFVIPIIWFLLHRFLLTHHRILAQGLSRQRPDLIPITDEHCGIFGGSRTGPP